MSHLRASAGIVKPRVDEYDKLEPGIRLYCKVEEFPDPIHCKTKSCYRLTRHGLADPEALCCCLQVDDVHYDCEHIDTTVTMNGKIMFFPGNWLNIIGITHHDVSQDNPIESWEFVILEQERTWLQDEYEGPVRRFVR